MASQGTLAGVFSSGLVRAGRPWKIGYPLAVCRSSMGVGLERGAGQSPGVALQFPVSNRGGLNACKVKKDKQLFRQAILMFSFQFV